MKKVVPNLLLVLVFLFFKRIVGVAHTHQLIEQNTKEIRESITMKTMSL